MIPGRPLSVQRRSQRIHDSSDEAVSHGNSRHPSGTDCLCALADLRLFSKENAADLILSYILHHPLQAVFKYQDLTVHGVVYAVDIGDAVAHPSHHADLLAFKICVLQTALQDADDALFCQQRLCPGDIHGI